MALETVLLAIGPNEGARLNRMAQTVIDIAGPAGASVQILHVFSEEEFESAGTQLDYSVGSNTTPEEVARQLGSVKTVVDLLEEHGVEYEIDAAIGDGGSLIVNHASKLGTDLIVVGGEKESPTGKAIFGSTAQKVMLNADSPVLFVKPKP